MEVRSKACKAGWRRLVVTLKAGEAGWRVLLVTPKAGEAGWRLLLVRTRSTVKCELAFGGLGCDRELCISRSLSTASATSFLISET